MSARIAAMPAPDSAAPPRPPRDAVLLGPLGFYDTMGEAEWRRLGATGMLERRRAWQAVAAALALARQQGRPKPTIERLDAARRRIVAEHRATLRWRRRQERRRRLIALLHPDAEGDAWQP